MKKPTFRLDETKHRQLMAKLTLNGESFQNFGEYVVELFLNDELYLNAELQIKKESINMKKTKEYVEGIKEYLESDKVIDLSACEDDGISYNDILDELDNQKVEYTAGTYYDVHDHLKHLDMSIYCEQFYIEQ